MTNTRVFPCIALALAMSLALGCSKKDVPDEPPAASAAPAAPPPLPAPSRSVDGPEVAGPDQSLMGRLAREAQGRPGVKPTADDVFAAFEKLGVSIPKKEQSLGNTYKAAYCVGGYTADRSLAINVCEYGTEAAATAGRDLSKSLFPDLSTREVWRRGATTMAIIEQKRDASTVALQKKLADAFAAL